MVFCCLLPACAFRWFVLDLFDIQDTLVLFQEEVDCFRCYFMLFLDVAIYYLWAVDMSSIWCALFDWLNVVLDGKYFWFGHSQLLSMLYNKGTEYIQWICFRLLFFVFCLCHWSLVVVVFGFLVVCLSGVVLWYIGVNWSKLFVFKFTGSAALFQFAEFYFDLTIDLSIFVMPFAYLAIYCFIGVRECAFLFE